MSFDLGMKMKNVTSDDESTAIVKEKQLWLGGTNGNGNGMV